MFDILELLSREQRGLNLTEIGSRLDLPRSTVYRLLSVLKNRNYIEKNTADNTYRLGMEFIELSSSMLGNLELKTEAQPYLRTLSRQTDQVVFLAVEQDDQIVYIEKIEKFNDMRKYCFIGQRRPLHCTALGKALLMRYDDDEIREKFRNLPMEKFTEKTISDIDTLVGEIRQSRMRGWAMDDEEVERDMRCISAPVFDYRNDIIASVSTSWDPSHHKDDITARNASYVLETARNISLRMGFRGGNNKLWGS